MTDLDLAALRQKAEAANWWGAWAIWPDLTEGGFTHVGNEGGVIPEGEIATSEDAEPNPIAKCYTPEIGSFIASANPEVMLALLDRVEAAEVEVLRQREINRRAERQTQAAEKERDEAREAAENHVLDAEAVYERMNAKLARVEALVKLLYPDDMTPTAKRQIDKALGLTDEGGEK